MLVCRCLRRRRHLSLTPLPLPTQALDALPLDALGPARVQAARDAYESLQRAALRAVADLAALQQRLAARLQEAAAQREAAQHGFTDAVQLIDKYREERDRAAREVNVHPGCCQFRGRLARRRPCAWPRGSTPAPPRLQAGLAADAAEAARKQAEGLSARLALLSSKLSELEDERRAELAPDLRAARDDGALLRSQLAGEAAKAAAARQEVADIAAKLEAVGGAAAVWQSVVGMQRGAMGWRACMGGSWLQKLGAVPFPVLLLPSMFASLPNSCSSWGRLTACGRR